MTEPKKIHPGIIEAVDKSTGNGLVWSKDDHESALRNPDPLKRLEEAVEVRIPPPPEPRVETKIVPDPELRKNPESEKEIEKPDDLPISKPAPKAATPRKKKTQRKETPPVAETDSTLSPFLSWLKTKPGSEYVHPYDESQESDQHILEQEEVVSETLADLLASQGYKERAIAMYSRLMQKYPEKSSFFAAKIEGLQ